jgi:hypothetical protein
MAPGPIEVYIPAGMWDDLYDVAAAAISEMNAGLDDFTFSITESECDGPDCIKFREYNENYSGCAATEGVELEYVDDFGEVETFRIINLPTSASWRNWRTRPLGRLKRTISHELAHAAGGFYGHDGACSVADSIMAPGPPNLQDDEKCNSLTQPTTWEVSPNDNEFLPINDTTFGDVPRNACGF